MWGKIKILILSTALLLSLSIMPNGASADSSFNKTIQPGQTQWLAEESIWLGTTVQGSQRPVYSGGNSGVIYIVKDSKGATVGQNVNYELNFSINIDTKALGETLSLWGKNVYKGAKDAVKVVGKWLD